MGIPEKKNLTDESPKWGHLLDSLFRYMDGSISILEIAEKHDLPFDALHRYLRRFRPHGAGLGMTVEIRGQAAQEWAAWLRVQRGGGKTAQLRPTMADGPLRHAALARGDGQQQD